jgi:hypothetical protein
MSFEESLRRIETARADLRRSHADSSAWSDDVRRRFDAQRLTPLEEAGTRITVALRMAQERCDAAERLLRDEV